MSNSTILSEFQKCLSSASLIVDKIIADGHIHRCPVEGRLLTCRKSPGMVEVPNRDRLGKGLSASPKVEKQIAIEFIIEAARNGRLLDISRLLTSTEPRGRGGLSRAWERQQPAFLFNPKIEVFHV